MAEKKSSEVKKTKNIRVPQSDFPAYPLEYALKISQSIWDNFAGKGGAPHDIAMALDMSPTSGTWRGLCGSSTAYGLTEGGYGAKQIILTPLGKRIVAPTTEGDDILAKSEAILQPKIMNEFFQKYNKAKFPNDTIIKNILVSMGLPKDRASKARDILEKNGRYVGVIKNTKTGLFVALYSQNQPMTVAQPADNSSNPDMDIDSFAQSISEKPVERSSEAIVPQNNKVYISHGKNTKIADQLKEILKFGKFDPIISIERESTSIPVPEKVFKDMRDCFAGVIHVMREGELLDAKGNQHVHINQNVLIEIGAAIGLYGSKGFVLLVENGVKLPSNLQGLYKCEYEGDSLDYAATMKLLKVFNEL